MEPLGAEARSGTAASSGTAAGGKATPSTGGGASSSSSSSLQLLPQEIKTVDAKQTHFEYTYTTPMRVHSFRCSDDIRELQNAPVQNRQPRPLPDKKSLDEITVALFVDDEDRWPKKK